MMTSQEKANGFLKDLGIYHKLSESHLFTHKGVEFQYSENEDGVGILFFNGFWVFEFGCYTDTALFDHGKPVKILDTEGNRSNKKHFQADLEACYTS